MTNFNYGYPRDYDAAYGESFHRADVRRSGRFWAMTVYALYGLAFFTAVTAPIGVFIAYLHRHRHGRLMRETFDWQIKIFWVGILVTIAAAVAHTLVAGLAAMTFGAAGILIVVPWAMMAAWYIWTIWAVVRGVSALT